MKILKRAWLQLLLARILWLYCRFVFLTSRIVFPRRERLERYMKRGTPVIFAFWHGRMFFMPPLNKRPDESYAIISRHRDGGLFSHVMECFGTKQIRGSSNRSARDAKGAKDRGGGRALKEAIARLKEGRAIVITPDGPKGPRCKVQPGLVFMARCSGAPVVPLAAAASFGVTLKTWDRFLLPLPFGKIVILCGAPVYAPEQTEETALEKTSQRIENQLNSLARQADRMAGRKSVDG